MLILVILAALFLIGLTRHTVWLAGAFYFCYGLFTILMEGEVPSVGGISAYHLLYGGLAFSILVNFFAKDSFLDHVHRWPIGAIGLLLLVVLTSSLYAQGNRLFLINEPLSLPGRLVTMSLVVTCAAQVRRIEDLGIFSWAVIVTSLVLSVDVVWRAVQLDFSGYRGGGTVNQNYVSTFISAGIIPLVSWIIRDKRGKPLAAFILILILIANLILASRGTMAAALFAVVTMIIYEFGFLDRRVVTSFLVVILLAVASLTIPGVGVALLRLDEGDLNSLNERLPIWVGVLDYISRDPVILIFGEGLSTSGTIVGHYSFEFRNTHNVYLQWLAESGLCGAAFFLYFLGSVTVRVARCAHPDAITMFGWMMFLLSCGWTSTIGDLHIFWIIMGILIGISGLAGPEKVALEHAQLSGSTHCAAT